jgi:hypothetical protein
MGRLHMSSATPGTQSPQQDLPGRASSSREHGADRIYWHTQQYNGRARSLYDTLATATSFVVHERDLE